MGSLITDRGRKVLPRFESRPRAATRGRIASEKTNLSPESLSSQKINGAPAQRVMHSCFRGHSVAVADFVSHASNARLQQNQSGRECSLRPPTL